MASMAGPTPFGSPNGGMFSGFNNMGLAPTPQLPMLGAGTNYMQPPNTVSSQQGDGLVLPWNSGAQSSVPPNTINSGNTNSTDTNTFPPAWNQGPSQFTGGFTNGPIFNTGPNPQNSTNWGTQASVQSVTTSMASLSTSQNTTAISSNTITTNVISGGTPTPAANYLTPPLNPTTSPEVAHTFSMANLVDVNYNQYGRQTGNQEINTIMNTARNASASGNASAY